jgi:SAM-dependent methyltransferase
MVSVVAGLGVKTAAGLPGGPPLDPSLRCPCERKAVLDPRSAELACTHPGCGQAFPVVRGVPVLINDANSVFARADYVGGHDYEGASYTDCSRLQGSPLRRAARRFAVSLTEFNVALRVTTCEQAIERMALVRAPSAGDPLRILVVGCGSMRYPERDDRVFAYTDVAFGPCAQYVCDAHDLPFCDESFDTVVASAVLEHVADPQRCVGEFHRVLRPAGWVYAVTPFLQPVHMAAHDFTRFTHLGHRRLFRRFDEIESGMALGPASSLAYCFQEFLISFFTRPATRKAARLVALLITRPLKYFDLILQKKPGALDAAAGVYFIGTKRERPVSDRNLIRQYRGLNGK